MNGALQFLAAGLFCLMISIAAGEWRYFHFSKVPSQAWIALFYLVFMGSIIAYLSYLFLLKVRPAAQVSTYVYVNPVIALLLGGWLAKERISPLQGLALAIILAGVLFVNRVKYKTLAN
jgi:drug/metabolite transporter (DMT)-like permease